MPPTDSVEQKLESEQKKESIDDNPAENAKIPDAADKEKTSKQEEEEEMVTSFIEGSPVSRKEHVNGHLSVVNEEKVSETAVEANVVDPGEGTSGGHEKNKSVVINLSAAPPTQPEVPVPSADNEEKLVINGINTTHSITTSDCKVHVFDDATSEGKQKTTSVKSSQRHELVRWDNQRSCFFVFFLLLFVLWVIAYYLYASEWLYRKINNIR